MSRARRSIDLDQLVPIFAKDSCSFVSLQYGNVSDEIKEFNTTHAKSIVEFPQEAVHDFEELAGLIEALDLVVSVQNTTVHICGALGKTCLTMVPCIPGWQYGVSGNGMAWYSSIELFRQTRLGEWAEVINNISTRVEIEIARKMGRLI